MRRALLQTPCESCCESRVAGVDFAGMKDCERIALWRCLHPSLMAGDRRDQRGVLRNTLRVSLVEPEEVSSTRPVYQIKKRPLRAAFLLAEREGFEPSLRVSP